MNTMSLRASSKVQYLVKENVEQFEQIGTLEAARKENYITLAKTNRRIIELEPEYNKAPWSDPRHPEDQRGIGALKMLRSSIERSLRDQEMAIRICYSNIEFNKVEIEQLQKEALCLNFLSTVLKLPNSWARKAK